MTGARPPLPPARKHVLIIDDEPEVRHLLAEQVRHMGYSAETCSPWTALQRLRAGFRYLAVLCDWKMPLVSGADVLEEVRLLDADQAGRFSFVTGWPVGELPPDVPALTKPVDLGALAAFLRGCEMALATPP